MLNAISRLTLTNPLVLRTVQAGSRRTRDLWVRLGYLLAMSVLVLGALLGLGLFQQAADLNQLAKAGSAVFAVVAYGQVVAVCLIAPLFMAGAIASERSGQTYNILLTTPLSNLQVVLGALLGRLFLIWTLLISGLPLFAVLLLFGGVPAGAVFEAFAIAALTALLVGAVAVLLSVFRAGGRKAVFGFVVGVAGLLLSVYLVDVAVLRGLDPGPHTTVLTPLHPVLVLESSVQAATYRPPPLSSLAEAPGWFRFYMTRPFATFALLSTGVSLGIVLVCAVLVRRVGQGVPELVATLPGPLRGLARRTGLVSLAGGGGRSRAPRPVTGNPIAWREARGRSWFGLQGLYLAGTLAVGGALLWLHHTGRLGRWGNGGAAASPTVAADFFQTVLTAVLVVQAVVAVLVAVYASAGCVCREREDGSLDILLTTPLTPRLYLRGKLRGLVQSLLPLLAAPLLVCLMAWGYTQVTGSGYQHAFASGPATASVRAPLVSWVTPVAFPLLLTGFVSFVAALGVNASLRSRTVLRAVVLVLVQCGGLLLLFTSCGLSGLTGVPLLGPAAASLSPLSGAAAFARPFEALPGMTTSAGSASALAAASALAVAVFYVVLAQALLSAAANSFDQTVRRLSGG